MSFKCLGAKDPNVACDYQFDFSPYFTGKEDTLSSVTADVVDATGTTVDVASDLIVFATTQTASGIVTVYLTGGTANTDYHLRVVAYGARATPIQVGESKTVRIPVRQL